MLGFMDSMRGIAILMVIATHVAASIPGLPRALGDLAKYGQTGVQLFFVASAYTLSLSWDRRAAEPRPVLRFLLRRWFRIAPMYYLGIALFAALHFGLQADTGAVVVEPYTPAAIAANLLFVHGFVPDANNTIVPGGWSIGTEMAFYALFPLLAGPLARLAKSHGAGAVLAVAGGMTAFEFAARAAFGTWPGNNSFWYFHIANQLPAFVAGIALYHWHACRPHPAAAEAAGWAVFAFATAATLAIWRSAASPAFVLVPLLAAIAYAGLGHALSGGSGGPAWLRSIGKMSFSMYVVHTLFAWHVERALLAPANAIGLPPALQLALCLPLVAAASYAAARLCARAVENPGIAIGSRIVARIGARGASAPVAATR